MVNVLRGILLMSIENSPVSYVQQFRPSMKMLVVNDNIIQTEWPVKLSINEIFSEKDLDDSFKLTSLYVTLDLICRFCKLTEDILSVREIWTPHLLLINALEVILILINFEILYVLQN